MTHGLLSHSISLFVALCAACGGQVDRAATTPEPGPVSAASASPCAPGSSIALLSRGNGDYVTADLGYNNTPLRAEANHMLGWEVYRIVDAGGGWVALKSGANGLYVSADLNASGAIEAGWATTIQGWEQFQFVSSDDGWYGLKSNANGLYVSANLNAAGSPLQAGWATTIQGWEQFRCVPFGSPSPQVVGYYAQTWEGSTPPAGVNVGVAFSGEIDVDAALSESETVLSGLGGAHYISLGGGDSSGRWQADRLAAITAALQQGRFGQYMGIVYDVEEGDPGLAAQFHTSFAAAKAAGKQVLVTISHSAPYGISDAAALMQAFFNDQDIDFLSPQLYTSGTEGQNDYATSNGVDWSAYSGMHAQLAPSIVSASYYGDAQGYFSALGLTTAGFVKWKSP